MCSMTHSCVWHVVFTCVSLLIHTWNLTHLHVWHDSFMCVTWCIHMCEPCYSSTRVTRLIHMCGMPHSYVWHGVFICASHATHPHVRHASSCVWRGVFTCVSRATQPHVRHDSFMCVTCCIHMCDTTHPHVWHDSSTCAAWLIHVCVWHGVFTCISHTTHPHVRRDSFMCVTWCIHMCDMMYSHVFHDTSSSVLWGQSWLKKSTVTTWDSRTYPLQTQTQCVHCTYTHTSETNHTSEVLSC